MPIVKNNLYDTYEERLKEELPETRVEEVSEIYTYQIPNEHDKIFKDILKDKEEARKFINQYLKLEVPIEKDKLELYNSSYITAFYQNKEADIVYKKVDQNIFFLIEHQSTIDLSMPYRMENYTMEIINMAVDKQKMKRKDYRYPKVISIVLYTGHKRWKANLSFSDVQEKLEGYQEKDKTYAIIDVNNFSKEELLKEESFISKVLLLESSKSAKELLENAQLARRKTPKDKLEKMDKILSVMLRKYLDEQESKEFLENLKKERKDKKMVLAVERMLERECRKLRKEGREKGIKEGIKEGKIKSTIQFTKKLIDEGMDTNFIERITGLNKEKIEELRNHKEE